MASRTNAPMQFTDAEAKLFVAILQHIKGTINTDWEAVAQQVGLKDGSIAKVRYRQIRKKRIEHGTAGSLKSPTVKVQKSSPKKTRSKKPCTKSTQERSCLEEEDEESILFADETDSHISLDNDMKSKDESDGEHDGIKGEHEDEFEIFSI